MKKSTWRGAAPRRYDAVFPLHGACLVDGGGATVPEGQDTSGKPEARQLPRSKKRQGLYQAKIETQKAKMIPHQKAKMKAYKAKMKAHKTKMKAHKTKMKAQKTTKAQKAKMKPKRAVEGRTCEGGR